MNGKPNVLLLRVDQLRADCVGAYGNTICKTPYLDSLADEGVLFDHAYTSISICSPARASLLTGLYPHNHGSLLNVHIDTRTCDGLDPTLPNLTAMLSKEGYHLEKFGKWHVHNTLSPCDYGFDRYHPFLPEDPKGMNSEFVPFGVEWLFSEFVEKKEFLDFPNGKELIYGTMTLPLEKAPSYGMAEAAARFLCEHFTDGKNGKPLFLSVDFVQPHFPMIPPESYASMYDPADIPPWPNFNESFDDKPAGHKRKFVEWGLEGKGWDWWCKVVAMYYANISYVDACCGVLLDALERSGQADNTIVIFTTDHGDTIGAHGHFEKGGTMSEETHRIPLLLRHPALPAAPKTVDHFVSSLDIMPTLMEWCTGRTVKDIDGRSLVPILSEDSHDAPWRDSIFTEYHGDVWGLYTQRMVRTKRMKYVYNPYDRDELYNLEKDPYEMTNAVDRAEYASQLEEMRGRLHGWIKATKDKLTHQFVQRNFPAPIDPYGR